MTYAAATPRAQFRLTGPGARKSPVIHAAMARTEAARVRGLQRVHYLAPDTGMLFVFPRTDFIAMWMRNTPLSLDILFADEHGRVHTVHRNVAPMSDRTVRGRGTSKYVLELPAGYCARHGIDTGALLEPA